MPYFHAIAVFEACGSSSAEADRAAAALFKTVRHPRVRYYEHDTSGGLGPSPKTAPLSFTVIADFDVEAGNEESAADIVEEILDSLSTEAIQYFAHGITAGEQRVRPEQRAQHAAEPAPEREAHLERGDREERGGRKRGPRGRGRRRARGRIRSRSYSASARRAGRDLYPDRSASPGNPTRRKRGCRGTHAGT